MTVNEINKVLTNIFSMPRSFQIDHTIKFKVDGINWCITYVHAIGYFQIISPACCKFDFGSERSVAFIFESVAEDRPEGFLERIHKALLQC